MSRVSRPRLTGEAAGKAGRAGYLILAELREPIPNHQSPPPTRKATAPSAPFCDPDSAAATDGQSRILRPPAQPPSFTPEEHTYIYRRLPVRQPATAQTAVDHFRRLPLLYRDLAAASRARLAALPPLAHGPERQKRQRMALLAKRLADRYSTFRMALPRPYVEEAIAQWRSEPRASRFWGKALDQVEKVNSTWSITQLWVLLSIIQSALVARAVRPSSSPDHLALLLANGLAYMWSTTVMCEMLRARYTEVKADEQELHDLIGGLRP